MLPWLGCITDGVALPHSPPPSVEDSGVETSQKFYAILYSLAPPLSTMPFYRLSPENGPALCFVIMNQKRKYQGQSQCLASKSSIFFCVPGLVLFFLETKMSKTVPALKEIMG